MKNKKILLIIAIILVLLLSIMLFFVFRNKGGLNISGNIKKNSETVESMVTISQKNMSAMTFGTSDSEDDYRVHIAVSPYLTFALNAEDIKSFKVTNFKGDSNKGDVLFIQPTDLELSQGGRSWIFTELTNDVKNSDIQNAPNQGKGFSYNVVDGPTKYNEVRKDGYIMPNFQIIVRDIGSVNYTEILNRDNLFDSGKYMEYLGDDLGELNVSFQFDVEIEFENGERYAKRFTGALDQNQLENELSYTFELQIVE